MKSSGQGGVNLPVIELPIERGQALVRGLWRLLCAVLVGGIVFVVRIDWKLMWLTEKASFLALGVVMVCVALAAIGLAVSSVRWLLLAAWPGKLGIEVRPDRILLRLGPFGARTYDWSHLQIELDEAFDQDMIDLMPDDAFVPAIRHVAGGEDVVRIVMRFASVSHEELTRRLRPYVRQRLDQSS